MLRMGRLNRYNAELNLVLWVAVLIVVVLFLGH